jgi:serine/threonine protein kinase
VEAESRSPGAYVVKVLRKQWWCDPRAINMQRREAWIGSQVSHPNLLPVLSSSVQQPPFYLVMPRLTGQTLAQLINDRVKFPLSLLLWIVRQVTEGLAALYERTGMIHADVKPSNIFVAPSGHATLLDFGFAHTRDEAASWANRPVLGTLKYIAPEAITSSLATSIQGDMYGLGVSLYEALTGRLPHESDDPGELARSVHTLLAKYPTRRPSSYPQLIERLVRLEIECFSLR